MRFDDSEITDEGRLPAAAYALVFSGGRVLREVSGGREDSEETREGLLPGETTLCRLSSLGPPMTLEGLELEGDCLDPRLSDDFAALVKLDGRF